MEDISDYIYYLLRRYKTYLSISSTSKSSLLWLSLNPYWLSCGKREKWSFHIFRYKKWSEYKSLSICSHDDSNGVCRSLSYTDYDNILATDLSHVLQRYQKPTSRNPLIVEAQRRLRDTVDDAIRKYYKENQGRGDVKNITKTVTTHKVLNIFSSNTFYHDSLFFCFPIIFQVRYSYRLFLLIHSSSFFSSSITSGPAIMRSKYFGITLQT